MFYGVVFAVVWVGAVGRPLSLLSIQSRAFITPLRRGQNSPRLGTCVWCVGRLSAAPLKPEQPGVERVDGLHVSPRFGSRGLCRASVSLSSILGGWALEVSLQLLSSATREALVAPSMEPIGKEAAPGRFLGCAL